MDTEMILIVFRQTRAVTGTDAQIKGKGAKFSAYIFEPISVWKA